MDFFDRHYFSLYGSNPKHQGESHHVPLYYGVQYNHEGRFWLRINGGALLEAEGPTAFISHPGVFFEYGNFPGEPRHHNFICSHGERIAQYVSSGLLPIDDLNPLRKIADPARFLETMTRIMSLLQHAAPLVPPRAVLLYEDLLLQMSEPAPGSPRIPVFHATYFKKLIAQVKNNPQKNWNFQDEARKRNLTPTHFRRIFKAITGLPPQQFLIQCRLQLGAKLLLKTNNSVSAVADKTGIGSEFYFSRLFKAKYEVSPLKYRQEFAATTTRR